MKIEHQKMGLPFEKNNIHQETYHFENEHYDDNELQDQYDHNHLGNYLFIFISFYEEILTYQLGYMCICRR